MITGVLEQNGVLEQARDRSDSTFKQFLDFVPDEALAEGDAEFLEKPFNSRGLLAFVRRSLDGLRNDG